MVTVNIFASDTDSGIQHFKQFADNTELCGTDALEGGPTSRGTLWGWREPAWSWREHSEAQEGFKVLNLKQSKTQTQAAQRMD